MQLSWRSCAGGRVGDAAPGVPVEVPRQDNSNGASSLHASAAGLAQTLGLAPVGSASRLPRLSLCSSAATARSGCSPILSDLSTEKGRRVHAPSGGRKAVKEGFFSFLARCTPSAGKPNRALGFLSGCQGRFAGLPWLLRLPGRFHPSMVGYHSSGGPVRGELPSPFGSCGALGLLPCLQARCTSPRHGARPLLTCRA